MIPDSTFIVSLLVIVITAAVSGWLFCVINGYISFVRMMSNNLSEYRMMNLGKTVVFIFGMFICSLVALILGIVLIELL